jgi:transcriptional repressor NrdR
MNCPKCSSEDSKVIDSRSIHAGSSIRRRRECISCNFRFTTYEYIQTNPIMVIKKSGDREEFSREKLENSFHLACQKRPVSQEVIQQAIQSIEDQINNISNVEINGSLIGELVMEKLRSIDKVAFIRFASVYREFQDIGEFQAQIDDLKD